MKSDFRVSVKGGSSADIRMIFVVYQANARVELAAGERSQLACPAVNRMRPGD